MLEKQLIQLGFSKHEITVYVSLFDLGKVRAGALIEKTGLHRNLIYTALEELVGRGLVTKTTSKGVAEFVANNPTRLVEEQEERKQLAQVIAEKLLEKQEEEPTEVAVYEGAEELKRLRKKSLMVLPGETTYVLGGSSLSSMPSLESFWKWYDTAMDNKGLPLKLLFDRTTDKTILDRRNSYASHEAKYLPFGIETPLLMCFFQDHIDFTLLNQKKPLIFSLKSKSVVDGFKKYFEYFWNQNTVVIRGMKAVREAFYGMVDELNPEEEYYVLGGNFGLIPENMKQFFVDFHGYRVGKEVHANILAQGSSFDMLADVLKTVDPKHERSALKLFPVGSVSPVQINLYHKKAVIVVYGEEPTVITIDQPEVYQNFKLYFDGLWQQETVVEYGYDALRRTIYTMLDELKPGESYDVLGASAVSLNSSGQLLYDEFHKERVRQAVGVNMLVYKESYQATKDRFARAGDLAGKLSHCKAFVSAPPIPMQVNIFNQKIFLLFYGAEPTIIHIDKPEAYIGFKAYFDFLWNQKIDTGGKKRRSNKKK